MRDTRSFAMLMRAHPAPSGWQRFRAHASRPMLRAAILCALGAVPVVVAMSEQPETAALWFGPLRFTLAMSVLAFVLGLVPLGLDRATRAGPWVRGAATVAAAAMVVQVVLMLLSVGVHAVLPLATADAVQPVLCKLMAAASALSLVGPVVMGGALLRLPARRWAVAVAAVVVMVALQGQIVLALQAGTAF